MLPNKLIQLQFLRLFAIKRISVQKYFNPNNFNLITDGEETTVFSRVLLKLQSINLHSENYELIYLCNSERLQFLKIQESKSVLLN